MEENNAIETEVNEAVETIDVQNDDVQIIDMPSVDEPDDSMAGVALLLGAGALIGAGIVKVVVPGIKSATYVVKGFMNSRKEKKEARQIEELIKKGYKVSVQEDDDFSEEDYSEENTEN